MRKQLFDNHGRVLNYLRLAVTDRCNLRCFYCMPEEGIKYIDRKELLTYEEIIRTIQVLSELGIPFLKLRKSTSRPMVLSSIHILRI